LDLTGLESFLKPRIESAENGNIINKSVLDIFAEIHAEERE
jgi:Antitoxin ParD